MRYRQQGKIVIGAGVAGSGPEHPDNGPKVAAGKVIGM